MQKLHASERQLVSSFGDPPSPMQRLHASERELVSLFSVDGVPHFGFISAERKLLQTLIGNVPRQAMEASLRRLL